MHTLQISQTGQNLYDLVTRELTEFGIELNQIFSVTTDNGINLIKMAKIIENELCHQQRDLSDDESDSEGENQPQCGPSVEDHDQTDYFFDEEDFNEDYFHDLLSNVRDQFSCEYFLCHAWTTFSSHRSH